MHKVLFLIPAESTPLHLYDMKVKYSKGKNIFTAGRFLKTCDRETFRSNKYKLLGKV